MERGAGRELTQTREGLMKTMWLEVMKEFSCKAVSTRSTCDDRKETAFKKNLPVEQ